jgi:hypothetical protein
MNVGNIPNILWAYQGWYEPTVISGTGAILFYWVPLLDAQTMNDLKASVSTTAGTQSVAGSVLVS